MGRGYHRISHPSDDPSLTGRQKEGAMVRVLKVGAILFALVPLTASARQAPPLPETGTFSILGFDPDTGEIGAAVQSRVFSVGNGVLTAEAGVGAVATQAVVDVGYGPKGMALLRQGLA